VADLPRKHLHTLPTGTALPDASQAEEGFPFLLATTSGSVTTRTLYQNQGGTWTGIAVAAPPATTVTASYTLLAGDANKTLLVNAGSAATITVPASTTVAFPVGTVIKILALGSGTVTVAPAADVTVNSLGAHTAIAGQYGEATLRCTDTDTWILSGDLA
jgi:hypothetical protein